MGAINYTKGSWEVKFAYGELDRIVDGNKETLLEIVEGFYGPKLADAYLIAAAPELLEALKAIRMRLKAIDTRFLKITNSPFETELHEIQMADKAIAKAEGQ